MNKALRKIENKNKTGQYKSKTAYRSAKNSIYVIDLKKKATPTELIVKNYLEENKVKFRFQKGFMNPFHRIVDFYLPKPHRLIIEIDGGYHNNTKFQDKRKDEAWEYHRIIKTLRIKNEDVLNGKFKEIFKGRGIC